jgi:hypothetical protein
MGKLFRLGAAVLALSAALVMIPSGGVEERVLAQEAKGKKDGKPEEPKAIQFKEVTDNALAYKLAFGDQKFLSKTIELSLKSKVIEENQGGLLLMSRLNHFAHSKLAVKFMESDNELTMTLASIVLMRCTNTSHLSDLFKRWDKMEAEKAEKLKHFRPNLNLLNASPEAIKLLLDRAKQDKQPEQAELALKLLQRHVHEGKVMTLEEMEKHVRSPDFAKSMKLRATLHKPQSSSMTLYYPAWDLEDVKPACGTNFAVRETDSFQFSTEGIERGEKQGFEVRFKILVEKDDAEIVVRMKQPGEDGGIGNDFTGKRRLGKGEAEIPMQNTGRWIELHFAWMPWKRADGSSAMGAVNSEGLQGGGVYYDFGARPPIFMLYGKKGTIWVTPGEITRIDRLP